MWLGCKINRWLKKRGSFWWSNVVSVVDGRGKRFSKCWRKSGPNDLQVHTAHPGLARLPAPLPSFIPLLLRLLELWECHSFYLSLSSCGDGNSQCITWACIHRQSCKAASFWNVFFSETHSPSYCHGHCVGDSFKHNSLLAAPVEPHRSAAHPSLVGGWGCSLWLWMCFTQRALFAGSCPYRGRWFGSCRSSFCGGA